MPYKDIAKHLNRSYSSIQNKAKILGVTQCNSTPQKKWTDDEKKYLKVNYGKKTRQEMAVELNRTESSVASALIVFGIAKKKEYIGKPWSEYELNYLKEHANDMTHGEMANALGRSKSAVQLKFNRLGLTKSKYTYDTKFFYNINSEEKAYWLGFISADGYVQYRPGDNFKDERNYELGVELQASDYKHLKKFNKSLNGNVDIKFRERVTDFSRNSKSKFCLIRFYSKELIMPLVEMGLANGKSTTLKFPKIKDEYIRHYIRGFFDGDGCVTVSSHKKKRMSFNFICASSDFINQLKNILSEYGIKSYIIHEKAYGQYQYKYADENGYLQTYRLYIRGVENCLNFSKYMYDDASVYLDRKFIKTNKLINDFKLAQRVNKRLPLHSEMSGFLLQ